LFLLFEAEHSPGDNQRLQKQLHDVEPKHGNLHLRELALPDERVARRKGRVRGRAPDSEIGTRTPLATRASPHPDSNCSLPVRACCVASAVETSTQPHNTARLLKFARPGYRLGISRSNAARALLSVRSGHVTHPRILSAHVSAWFGAHNCRN
jgi:hypothetical protein